MGKLDYRKTTCELCPFSRSKTLWLHPGRAEDFAYMAENPYSNFPCHKTADHVEETEWQEGGFVHGQHSLTCAGFRALQINCNEDPDEFENVDPDGFCEAWDMIEHHTEHWEAEQERIAKARQSA